jgi:hypothetical protein
MLAHAFALEMESIRAAKIKDTPLARGEAQFSMLARNLGVTQHDIILCQTPYPQVLAVKRDAANLLRNTNFQIGHHALQRRTPVNPNHSPRQRSPQMRYHGDLPSRASIALSPYVVEWGMSMQ